MNIIRAILPAILLCVVSSGGKSNTYLDNPSHVADRLASPYLSPIGELESYASAKCSDSEEVTCKRVGTGFLVSPCYVMTAAHVVFGKKDLLKDGIIERISLRVKRMQDYPMTFRIGYSDKAPFLGSTTANPLIAGMYDGVLANDWVLMKLSSCVGSRYGFGWYEPPNLLSRQMLGMNIIAAGYPADAPRGTLEIGLGRFLDLAGNGFGHIYTASIRFGQSGGPILSVVNGRVRVVGLIAHHYARASATDPYVFPRFSPRNPNVSLNIVSVLLGEPEVRKLLIEDRRDIQNPLRDEAPVFR